MISMVVKNLQQFKRALEKEEKRTAKASVTATRVEAFRLFKELAREIKAGAPGGRRFEPLREITKGPKTRRKPFTGLASTSRAGGAGAMGITRGIVPVRYGFAKTGKHTVVSIGFTEKGKGTLSASWKRIMKQAQKGVRKLISEDMRKGMIQAGAKLTARTKRRKFYFLKKSTTHFKTPARLIIDPFWSRHQREAFRNINRNFERKMKGERI